MRTEIYWISGFDQLSGDSVHETRDKTRGTEHRWFDCSHRFYRFSLSSNTGAIDTVDWRLDRGCISGWHFNAEELSFLADNFGFVFFQFLGGLDWSAARAE